MGLAMLEDVEAIRIQSGIRAGEEVWNGFPGQYCVAPIEPGTYSLYELADPDTMEHVSFMFVKEV